MAISKHDTAVSDGFMFAVSVFFCLLRLVQHFARRTRPRASEVLGTVLLAISTACVITLFTLARVEDTQEAAAGDKLFPQDGQMLSYALLAGPNHRHVVQALLQPAALWAIKGSYLCTFWGVSEALRPIYRRAVLGITVWMIISYFVGLLVDLLWCRPLSSLWIYNGVFTKCFTIGFLDITPFSVKFAMSLSTDLTLAVFSIFLIQTLQVRKDVQLWAFITVFAIGFMSIIACVLRYVYDNLIITQADSPQAVNYSNSFLFWQSLEVFFATTAYGFTTARSHMRWLVEGVNRLHSYMTGSRISEAPYDLESIDTSSRTRTPRDDRTTMAEPFKHVPGTRERRIGN